MATGCLQDQHQGVAVYLLHYLQDKLYQMSPHAIIPTKKEDKTPY